MNYKKINCCVFFLGLLFIFTSCRSEPANVQNKNVNTAAASPEIPAETSSPKAEKSVETEEKPSEANYPQIVQEIHRGVNEFRQSQGLQPLTLNAAISEQAREHSVEMSQTPDTISHKNFDERVKELRQQMPYQASAENVAVNVNYENPGVQAVEGWKNSPSHRKNMLGDYNQTGIGIARGKDGGYFFTQIFWKP